MKNKKIPFTALALLIIWVVSDALLVHFDPVCYSPYFQRNDFEITKINHPEKEWDKVIFGSSVAINSYEEEFSKSGYINAGICYGTVSDAYMLLKTGNMKVKSDLVIMLNDIAFYDDLPTNPTYIWNKKWYEHYLYFERDRLHPLFKLGVYRLLKGKNPIGKPKYAKFEKYRSYGVMPDNLLLDQQNKMFEEYKDCTVKKNCTKNMKDLQKLIDYCGNNGIRLRAVWMPWNPKVKMYDFAKEVQKEANKIMDKNNIDVCDMTDSLAPEFFHDIGHLEYANGVPCFTELLDRFLMQ